MRQLINIIILAAVIFLLFASYTIIHDAFYDFKNLNPHFGIVSNVDSTVNVVNKSKAPRNILIFQMDQDTAHYIISRYFNRLADKIRPGDSMLVYTKPITSIFGNAISEGNNIWTTNNPNEVFHLVSTMDQNVLIDFKENSDTLKRFSWAFPLFSLVVFIWYLYRRSEKKSIFIIEKRQT